MPHRGGSEFGASRASPASVETAALRRADGPCQATLFRKKALKKDLRFFARAAYERRQSTSNRAKSMKRFSFAYLILSGLASSSLSVMAGPGIAYPDPPGGWTYILDGSQAAPGTASAAF